MNPVRDLAGIKITSLIKDSLFKGKLSLTG